MSTLIPMEQDTSDKDALAVGQAKGYYPRIKLCQGSAKEVAKKKVKAGGCFALIKSKEDITDLGEEVEIIVCKGRPKALQTGEVILTNYEKDSEEFKRIQDMSKEKDSNCMFGPEYLVYLPGQKIFATYHMNSATARQESGEMHEHLGNPALLRSHYIEKPKFSWWGPLVEDAPTPADLPTVEEFVAEIAKYMALRSSKIRKEEDVTGEGERDR